MRSTGHSRTKPNILFIFTDQQSAGIKSCTGNAHVSTPARMRPTTCKVDRSGHCVKATRRQGATISSWKWH